MMSHMYEGLLRNTISETGSEIPGHKSGLDNASDREKQPVPGGREVWSWQLFIFFLQGEREAQLKQRYIYNSC